MGSMSPSPTWPRCAIQTSSCLFGRDEPWQDFIAPILRTELSMTLPAATLDHVVINARDDMDRAADIYRRLGFTLTERGYHSLGSMNHLAMFGTDYLELIAVPKGATSGRLDLLDYAFGLNGLVFGSRGFGRHLRRAPPRRACRSSRRSSSRGPSRSTARMRDARFRTVRMKAGVVPYGRVYYCHHFTRDLVWRDEWRHHRNGAVAVARALSSSPIPPRAPSSMPTCSARDAVRDIKGGKSRHRRQLALRHRDRGGAQGAGSARACPMPRGGKAYMAGLTFRTVSARRGGARLAGRQDRRLCPERDGRLVVPASQAVNAVLEFVE